MIAAAIALAACGPTTASGRPTSGTSAPVASVPLLGDASASGDPVATVLPVASTPGGPPSAPASHASSPGPAAPSPTPIPGAWSTLRWSSAGTIRGAVQLVAAVRWRDLDVVAGLAFDASGGLSTAIWTSSDGQTWTVAANPDGTFGGVQIERLVAGAGRLVAFGVAAAGCPAACPATLPVVAWSSTDGRTWAASADGGVFAGARITGAAAGPSGFLVAGTTGSGGAAWTSRDGRSWAHAPGGTFPDATPTSVAWFRGTWLLGGRIGGQAQTAGITPPSTSRAAAWWSTDGQAWHAAAVQGTAERGATLGSIEVGRDGLVAVGSDMPRPGRSAFAWTSDDGRSWVPAGPDGDALPAFDVAGNGTQIVALGPGPGGTLRGWASVDGAAWQAIGMAGTTSSLPGAPGAARPTGIGAWFALPDGLLASGRPRGGTTVAVPMLVATGR